MVNSKLGDLSTMRVIDLRKELKSRGLPCSGDKSELKARLEAAISHNNHEPVLDSLELDSDGVLDEDDKTQNDLLEDTVEDVLNEELALAEPTSPTSNLDNDSNVQKILKRKITTDDVTAENEKMETDNNVEKDSVKKIVLVRGNLPAAVPKVIEDSAEDKQNNTDSECSISVIKTSAKIDPKARLELRAKRFGLPVKMTDADRKEARKYRFSQNTISKKSTIIVTPTDNIDKLKQRAERFGQSVSKVMTDFENKEKLEKRKAKFASVK